MAFNKVSYDNDYKRQYYDEIRALVPKGKKAVIKECATKNGVTISALVVRALEGFYGIDLSKD